MAYQVEHNRGLTKRGTKGCSTSGAQRGLMRGAKADLYKKMYIGGLTKRGTKLDNQEEHKRGLTKRGTKRGGAYQEEHKRGTFLNGGLPRGAQKGGGLPRGAYRERHKRGLVER